MKGSISEFELGIIRSRMYEAARSKARRGELRISSPIGYAWDRNVGLGLDPDRRLQEVIRLVFQKFCELGSARQVLLWMASQNVHFPYPSNGRTLTSFEWRPIRYRNVISILKNPFYAGVYAYGKSEKRTTIVDGRARKSYGHHKPMGTWEVFIKDHHEGYISWAEFERNQALLAGNAYGRVGDTKSGRGAELELQQAQYDASLAERRYAACDPDNRLIAAQLEKAWETALQRVELCRDRLDRMQISDADDVRPDFTGLADDLSAAWKAPRTTMRTRQRLVRALITEIIVDIDDAAGEIVLVIHWKGG